jgi:chromosome segregation ATPase
MTTENDTSDPGFRVRALTEQVRVLQGLLHSKKLECASQRADAERWKSIAEREHKHFIDSHNALNLLRQDAMAVMEKHDAVVVYRQLEAARETAERLGRKLEHRREFSRRTAREMALAREEKRDLEEVVAQLREKVANLETRLEQLAAQAQDVIDQRDAQIRRFRTWCEKWLRGEVGAMETLAALACELNTDLVQEPTVLERRRAVEHAELVALVESYQQKEKECQD